ncbi:hypothetical protein [Buchnera aphidicola]
MINPVIIGKIGSSYGILGWNTIFSFTEKKKIFFNIFRGLLNRIIFGR